jgi:serine/threonine-protein kinase
VQTQPPDSVGAVTTRAFARVGRTLREKWTLERLLGVGGMASVYAATHRNGSRAAIKMLHVELSVEPEICARFLREGYVANAVGHPGVARVLDDDVSEDGAAFLVMELLAGETLDARWERKGQRLFPDEVLPVVDALLDVLAAAHDKGIIHRDVKPENVFLTHDGAVKLLDFGIARHRDAPGATATQSGAALGTPAFMAPEQAMGSASEIGPLTDVWAVGATLFVLLSGETVHEARNPNQQLIKSATVPPRSLATVAPDLPRPVIDLVDRALAFDKKDRWPSARAMQEATRAAYEAITGASVRDAAPLSVPAPRESAAILGVVRPGTATTGGAGASTRAVPAPRPVGARRPLAIVGVVATLALVFAAGWLARRSPPSPPITTTSATASAATTMPSATASAPPPPAVESASPVESAAPVASAAPDLATAKISVIAQGGTCEISIDDVPTGRTPVEDARVTPGEHRVVCKLPAGGSVSRRVRATAGKTAIVSFAMAPVDPMDKRK